MRLRRRTVSGFMLMLIVVSAFNAGLFGSESLAGLESPASAEVTISKDVLIIDDPHKRAYFGWYGASQMPPETTVFAEDFEDGTLDSWDFAHSTNASQNGSILAGTWSSSIVSGGSSLSGAFSGWLFAESTVSVDPWQVNATIDQVISIDGVTGINAVLQFDQITDPGVGGAGHAFFLIDIVNALNTSEHISYGFDNSPSETVGDISYDVSPGELVGFSADVDIDFFGKYGKEIPNELLVLFRGSADYAELGNGVQTIEVRVDDITLQGPSIGWSLLKRTIMWAASYLPPTETRIVFFAVSYNDDATAVYNWLIANGYSEENITIHDAPETELLPPTYYNDSDLVIYWETYGYDSTNIVNSTIPFITVSPMQTDEMAIGTGATTSNSLNNTFHVVNNNYYPTFAYSTGPLIFESEINFETTEAAADGRILVKAEIESVVPQVEMHMTQHLHILPEGNATMSFSIVIPESPLAEILRETFFTNSSSLEPDIEVDVPENKTVVDLAEAEKEIKDASLHGDVVGDGKIDMKDIGVIARIFGYLLGGEAWDPELDLNWDGKIDMRDISTAARAFGKNRETTGHLSVVGYYNGTAVNCTDVYYEGPEGTTSPINMTDFGHLWRNIQPGEYTVYGTFNSIETNTVTTVFPYEKASFAQLDFGGAPPPSPQSPEAPVKDVFHIGIIMDQLILLGFEANLTDSRIVQLSTTNETVVSLEAHAPHVAQFNTTSSLWQINVGPSNETVENATEVASEHLYTKIQYMQQMIRSLLGEQTYMFNWQLIIELPPGAILLNGPELDGSSWIVDFGGGTFMQANVSLGPESIIVDETMLVTEQNITASDEYLYDALAEYKVFQIDYAGIPGPLLSQDGDAEACVLDDWSKTWTRYIYPGTFVKSWSKGPLSATIKVTPRLSAQWYVGWKHKRKWLKLKLEKFETWMKITPSIKVEASVGASYSYSKTWSHTFWTWSRRFYFWVGPVPVWANLKLKVTGSVTVSAYGEISVSTWVEAEAWYKAGVKWERGRGWKTIWAHGSGVKRSNPTITGEAGLSITPKATCRVVFLFYDVAGPFVEAIPYAPITIRWYLNQPNTWSIELKFKIKAGVTFSGWLRKTIKLKDYSRTLADWTLLSWNGNW